MIENRNTLNDITSIEDIRLMVNTFYGEIRKDELLGSIFEGIIQDRWPEHLEKMYRFWQTILLADHTYYGSPFAPHAVMPLEGYHFERWVKIFNQVVDGLFKGEIANEAKWRANKMAEMFLSKIQYYQSQNIQPLI